LRTTVTRSSSQQKYKSPHHKKTGEGEEGPKTYQIL
jgi:hypothetical protein